MESNLTLIILALIAAVGLIINAYIGLLSMQYALAASQSSKRNSEKLLEIDGTVHDIEQKVDVAALPRRANPRGAKT